MSVVAELEASLEALKALKPPGVTKSRISTITQLCIENVKKLYTSFKRTPVTHKLGVLYVIDNVTRQWMEKASSAGQKLEGDVQDGTPAAGVRRITELLPSMMSDLIFNAPDDQKDKIAKLVDIWGRGGIFSGPLVSSFKRKIGERNWKTPASTTPPGSPPASLVKQQVSSSANAPATMAPTAASILSSLASLGGNAAASTPTLQQPQPPPSNHAPNIPAHQVQGASTLPSADTSNPLTQLSSILPPHVLANQELLKQHIGILQQLQNMNVPQSQWGDVIRALHEQQTGFVAGQPAVQSPARRNRSRSPSASNANPHAPAAYRQRSPVRGDSPSLNADMIHFRPSPQPMRPKWIEFDSSLPKDYIKVFSRTLFVGGTTCGENELRPIFRAYGEVQTVIAHPEKRHAFVKMCTRKGAEDAKRALDDNPGINQGKLRSVRWGVGFGPRECNDYQSGVAVIPIDRLTEADRKWVLTADYGGSGGRAIESNMCMEEPDIEIGAGVSSKALSDRQTGFQGRRGRDGNRGERSGGGGGRHQNNSDRGHRQSGGGGDAAGEGRRLTPTNAQAQPPAYGNAINQALAAAQAGASNMAAYPGIPQSGAQGQMQQQQQQAWDPMILALMQRSGQGMPNYGGQGNGQAPGGGHQYR